MAHLLLDFLRSSFVYIQSVIVFIIVSVGKQIGDFLAKLCKKKFLLLLRGCLIKSNFQ